MSTIQRVTHGVWRPSCDDLLDRVAALLTACPPGTVVGGVTAARLHGLWLPPADLGERIEVIVHPDVPLPADRPHSRRPEIRARRQRLDDDEVTMIGGLSVTGLPHTWRSLADRLSLPDLVALGDSALRAGATIECLEQGVRVARRHRGVVRARAALPLLDRRSRSRPESHLRCAVVVAGLPAPEVNVHIYSADGEWLAEPDLSFRQARLALEYNGADHADVDRMRRDITREIDVGDRGEWRVVTFGPVQVFRRTDQVANVVHRLLLERLPEHQAALLPRRLLLSTEPRPRPRRHRPR